MKKLLSTMLLMAVMYGDAHGAGLWNGSTSDLSATVSSTAISYPVVMAAWVELDESPGADCVLAISDNGAGGSLDALQLNIEASGGTAKAIATAAGSSSTASKSGLAATGRQFVAAVFTSASSRKVYVGGSYGTAESTTRNVGNFTRVSIGSLHNGGVTASFDGPITIAAIWTGIDPDNVNLLVDQLARGMNPDDAWHVATAYLYQPLVNGANETGKLGPSPTATAVDFEADVLDDYEHNLITINQRDARLALVRFSKPGIRFGRPDYGVPTGPTSPNNIDHIAARWPDTTSTPGPLPNHRVVTIGTDGKIQLAEFDSTVELVIGVTEHGLGGSAPPLGDESTWWGQHVKTRGAVTWIVEEDSADFHPGSTAYLTGDGKCDDSGTVPFGTVINSSGGFATVLPY